MSVIPPNRVEVAPNQIPWLNMQKVSRASAPQVLANKNTMAKTASASVDKIVHSYGCRCGKKWSADNAAFASQVNLAKRAGEKSVDLACPSCGEDVFPLNSIQRASSKDESRSAAIFAAKNTNLQTTSSTYNTFIDRHVVFKATQALQNYASKMGMHMPRAKYIQGVHTKEAGFDTPIITSFSAEIEWQYGRNQKMRVMANVGIDAAGKIKMPKVFKTADHQEHPFDKDYVIAMQKEVSPKMMGDTRRKTDLPQYRKTDPSRFRAVAAFGDESIDDPMGVPDADAELEAVVEANLHIGNNEGTLNVLAGAKATLLTKKEGLHTVAFQVEGKEVRIDMRKNDFVRLFGRASLKKRAGHISDITWFDGDSTMSIMFNASIESDSDAASKLYSLFSNYQIDDDDSDDEFELDWRSESEVEVHGVSTDNIHADKENIIAQLNHIITTYDLGDPEE